MKLKEVFALCLSCLIFLSQASEIFAEDAVWRVEKDFSKPSRCDRLCLDVKKPFDLRAKSGVSFDVECSDWTKFSSVLVYFKSGNGWYRKTFVPGDEPGVQNVTMYKRDMTETEGKVEGWGKITAMRFALYRTQEKSGKIEFKVSNFKYVSPKAKVVVVVGEMAHGKSGSVCASKFSKTLEAAGVEHVPINDHELQAEDLADKKVLVLPYNGTLPEGKLLLVRDFIAKGGKVVACYTVPREILSAIGVRRTGWFVAAKSGTGPFSGFMHHKNGQSEFVPQTSAFAVFAAPAGDGRIIANWASTDRKDTGKAAVLGTDKGVFLSHVWAGGVTSEKVGLMQEIFSHLDGCFDEGFAHAGKIFAERRKAGEASLRAIPGRSRSERFAAWCHSAYGPDSSWDEAVSVFAKAGGTDLIANLCWGGHAYYASRILPVDKLVSCRGDAFDLAGNACRKHSVRFHVWRVCGNLHGSTDEYRKKLDSENRLAVDFNGNKMNGWVCLSHPENIGLEIASMEELAQKGADGVHLDYIRYRDPNTCFCSGCRERFERFASVNVRSWPKDIRESPTLKSKWDEFRQGNIDDIVRGVYRRVKSVNPECEVSAAVFPDWTTAPVQVAQCSQRWCSEGILDFICPMNYSSSQSSFRNFLRAQKRNSHEVPILSGIGVSCWPEDGTEAARLADRITAVRKEGVKGWTIFDLDERGYAVIKILGRRTLPSAE